MTMDRNYDSDKTTQAISPSVRSLPARVVEEYNWKLKEVEHLLDGDLNTEDHMNELGSGLHAAACLGNFDLVQQFLDKGADIDHPDATSNPVLQKAIFYGNVELVRFLISHGADVNHRGGFHESPLLGAVRHGNLETIRVLLDHGADVGIVGNYGEAPLLIAVRKNDMNVVRLLLENGANIYHRNGIYPSALRTTMVRGSKQMIQLLLRKSADLTADPDETGKILIASIGRGDMDITCSFLDLSRAWEHLHQSSLLHAAVQSGKTEVLEYILKKHAYPELDFRSIDGQTPLHIAAKRGFRNAAKKLLDQGARTDIQDYSGETPLQIAIKEKQPDTAALLFTKKANNDRSISASTWRGVFNDSEALLEVVKDEGLCISTKPPYQLDYIAPPFRTDHGCLSVEDVDIIGLNSHTKRIL